MGRSGAVRCFVTAVIALELLCLQALRVPELEAGLLTTAPLPGRACLPADNLPVAAANLTADELQMLEYLCIVEEAFVHPPIRLETRSGVPEGVACAVTQWCGSGMCTEVCARGSVAVEPWLDNAIRMQTRLSRALPFCFSSMFGTHNSAISLADGYGNLDPVYQDLFRYIKWAGSDFSHAILRTNDQWLSLTDQLNLGVRVVEVDTHWVGGVLRVAHCGGLHVSALNTLVRALNTLAKLLGHRIRWDTETLGCDPSLSSIPSLEQRTLVDALEEVAAWMGAPGNEDELVVLFFDDQPNLATWGVVGRLLDDVLSVFPRDAIFTPADLSAWGDIWPTGAQIVSSGRRLVLVSGTDYGDAMAPLIFAKGARVCGWSEPWLGGIRGAPDCVLQSWRGPRQLYDGSLVRVFSCELQYGPLNCDFVWHGSNAPMLDEASLPGVDACGVNIPSPDLLTPSRAAAAVWSWAPGHPFEADVGEGTGAAAACGIIGADDGRWRASECSGQSLPSACRAAGKSLLSDEQWVLGQGERGECPEGSSFDLPKHPRENYWLAEVLKEAGAPAAWLPLQGPDWTLDAAFAAAGEHEQLMRVLDRSDEDVVLLQS